MKKVIALIMTIIICFAFSSCGKSNVESEKNENNNVSTENQNNILNNTKPEWYLKKRIFTYFENEASSSTKTYYEFDNNNNLILQKTYILEDDEFVETMIRKLEYDYENQIISLIGYGENESMTITFDKYYIDGHCICRGVVDNSKTDYFYQNGILKKIECYIDNELYSREIFDERGNTIRQEIPHTIIEYELNEDNLLTKYSISDTNGKIASAEQYFYDGIYIVKEIKENSGVINEINYTVEKIDNNTHKCSSSDGTYYIYVVDDFGNLISKSLYKEDGKLVNKTEQIWEQR